MNDKEEKIKMVINRKHQNQRKRFAPLKNTMDVNIIMIP